MEKPSFSRRQLLFDASIMTALSLIPSQLLAAATIPFEQWDILKPYLKGIYAPTDTENFRPLRLEVIGEIPKEISGAYFRNGPNPKYKGFKKHHWFDGDGMIHKIAIQNGQATYQNRWIETAALKHECARDRKLFAGLDELGSESMPGKLWHAMQNSLDQTLPSEQRMGRLFKDTANTDLIYFQGKIIPLWWLSGTPYAVDPETLTTLGVETFSGSYQGEMAAHARVDENTGDLFFLNFGQLQKFVSVNLVASDGRLKWTERFDLPYARIYHDLLFTKDYVLLLDFPMGFIRNPKTAKREIGFDRTSKNGFSRIVLIDRKNPKSQKIFEFPASYSLHGLNAYQEENKVILFVTKFTDPIVNRENDDDRIPKVGLLRVQTVTARWELNLNGMIFKESIIDDINTEFARINDNFLGESNRFSYHPTLLAEPQVMFDGLIKYDLQRGSKIQMKYGSGLVGEEVVFIPKKGAPSEDAGWLVTFVHDRTSLTCECRIYDACTLNREPVARIMMPSKCRIPYGFHAKWVSS